MLCYFKISQNQAISDKSPYLLTENASYHLTHQSLPKEFFTKKNPQLFKYSAYDHDESIKYSPYYFTKRIDNSYEEKVIAKIRNTDLVAYNVLYKFDRSRIRHVENQNLKTETNKFIITAGCSYTMGEGLNQGEDYPSQLAKKMNSEWKIYNWGFHGNSTNAYISQPEFSNGGKNIPSENNGVFIWLFISEHMKRYFCPVSCYNNGDEWLLHRNQIQLSDDIFASNGHFIDSSSPYRIMLGHFKKWGFFNYFRIPEFEYTDQQYLEFAKSINQMTTQTHKKFLKKYLFIYDNNYNLDLQKLSQKISNEGFTVIDLRPFKDQIPIDQQKIVGDSHPTALMNWQISEIIQQVVRQDMIRYSK